MGKITFFFFQFSLFLMCQEFHKIYANVPLACLMLVWQRMLFLWILDVLHMLFDILGNVFKQQGVWKIDYVVDVCSSRHVAKTAIFGTPTCAIASKLPQLLLLTPMVCITTACPNCLQFLVWRWAKCMSSICWLCFGTTSPINCFSWVCTHQRWLGQKWNSVFFSDESRFTIHGGDGRVRVYRRRNEHYANFCILERERFGGRGSVLVWAGNAHGFRTNHVVIEGNLNA